MLMNQQRSTKHFELNNTQESTLIFDQNLSIRDRLKLK